MFAQSAYALGSPASSGNGGGGVGLVSFVPLVIIFAIFYFLLIRPQQKRQAGHRKVLEQLKKGQRVITQGGIHGTVTRVKDDIVTIQIAEQVRVDVNKSAIASVREE
ncbi:MAG: preprotein translocase subunit YajC [Candidatus Tectomicrobia bacterium]|nr:preprotein translocase subunit YajC [Candidatus Tectomicrobia bacterium]